MTSSLDARLHPQGYITADLSSGRKHETAIFEDKNSLGDEVNTVSLQLLNMPITATIKLYIDFVDMESSAWDLFEILKVEQSQHEDESSYKPSTVFQTRKSVRDQFRVFSGNSTLTFHYHSERKNQRYSLRLSYTSE